KKLLQIYIYIYIYIIFCHFLYIFENTFKKYIFLKEDEIPDLEIDIDELLELTDEEQRSRLHELLQECGKPKEDFINGLLYRMKGLRKMSGSLKK
uniref:Uncharacterized protein n=1 Tax=Sinocyclocheilus rhinocerous TaxID=307959 RepID=A0A673LQG8_9TELE